MKARSVLLAALLGITSSAGATGLTFDFTPPLGNGAFMPQGYGDRVTVPTMPGAGAGEFFMYGLGGGLTPNVLVGYTGGVSDPLNFWSTGYSGLTNVVEYEVDGSSPLKITFTADPGFTVRLDRFDIGNFGGLITIPSIKVLNESSAELFSTTGGYALAASSDPHQTVTFGGGLSGQQLSLIIDLTGLGGNSDNVGLDNIQFAQTAAIPEPSTYALMIAGLGVVGFVARRRRGSKAA